MGAAHDKLGLDLLAVFAEKNSHLKEELNRMKKDTIPTFKVTLLRQGEWKEEFFANKTELVSTILKKVEDKRGVGSHQGHWALRKTISGSSSSSLKIYMKQSHTFHICKNKTFEENDIKTDTTLHVLNHGPQCRFCTD